MPKVTIDRDYHLVIVGKREVSLAFKEFNLLSILEAAKGRVVSRKTLIDKLWPDGHPPIDSRTVDQHIHRIRAKVGKSVIRTVSRVGYAWTAGQG